MAKSRRSKAEDTPNSSAPRPRVGRRRTDLRPKPANGEPASGIEPSPEAPDQIGPHDLTSAAPDTQDFTSPPQSDRFESSPSEPSEHEIRLRAYLKYLDRGAVDGADFDDWLQAEMELRKR